MQKEQTSSTEYLFSGYLTESNKATLLQIKNYKRTADIYERTQIALGRKVSVKYVNCSTDNIKINVHNFGSTNKI